jgi:YbgC/YbaW family acyl-CoA thioester hydrolase
MVPFERAIRFEEVDAAGIVFFARFVTYAHEAMENLFDSIEGGYSGLIVARRVGLPAVKVEMSFAAPLRYGDRLRIETTVTQVGNRSAILRYRMIRASDEVEAAEVLHTVVTTDLVTLRSCSMPPDVRARLLEHLEPGARTPPSAPPPTERAP